MFRGQIEMNDIQKEQWDQLNVIRERIVNSLSIPFFSEEESEKTFLFFNDVFDESKKEHIRYKYFFSKDFSCPPVKVSHYEAFRKNGLSHEDVFRHLHFLVYHLNYMVDGPNLPNNVIDAFYSMNGFHQSYHNAFDCMKEIRSISRDFIKSGDFDNRYFNIETEFFRMALDLTESPQFSRNVRQYVMEVKRSIK